MPAARPVAQIAGVKVAVARDGSGCGCGIVDVAGEGLRSAKADMADLAVGQCVAGRAVVAHGLADGAGVDRHVVAQAVEDFFSFGCIDADIRAEASALGQPQSRAHHRRHGGEFIYEWPRDCIAAVGGKLQARQVVAVVVLQHPFQVEHYGNLAEELHAVLLNGAQRAAGIEDLKKNRSPAAKERAHQDLGLRAHVRGGQIDERACAAVSAKECAAQAHVLRRDVAVREQRRFGRAGRSRGEDDQRAIVFRDRGSRPRPARPRRHRAYSPRHARRLRPAQHRSGSLPSARPCSP